MARTIRHERSFEGFSRGLEVVRAIHKLWRENDKLSRRGATASDINANIDALIEEFDLTIDEWHYWADIASEARS
jgi:hypothetical protein